MEHDDDETVSILEPVTEWRTNHTGKLREARRGKRSIFAARTRMCVCVSGSGSGSVSVSVDSL